MKIPEASESKPRTFGGWDFSPHNRADRRRSVANPGDARAVIAFCDGERVVLIVGSVRVALRWEEATILAARLAGLARTARR